MIAIPAMDLLDGRAVRLERGDYSKVTVYSDDPVAEAHKFAAAGIRRMHLVDLGAARDGEWPRGGIVESIASLADMEMSYGGGLRDSASVARALAAGVTWVVVGSYAVRDPQGLARDLAEVGPERFIVAADSLDGRIRTDGWERDSGLALADFVGRWYGFGVRRFLCTDINRDGMMGGANIDLYRGLKDAYEGAEIIASGGVSGLEDLAELKAAGLEAAVVGKAYWSGAVELSDLGEV